MPLSRELRTKARKIVELLRDETTPYLGHEQDADALFDALEAIVEGDSDAAFVAKAILDRMGEGENGQ